MTTCEDNSMPDILTSACRFMWSVHRQMKIGTGNELPDTWKMWHGQARRLSFLLVMRFQPCQILFVRHCILFPLLTFPFSFPLFPFFVSPIPVTQEISKAENNDRRVKGVIEVTVAGWAEIEEEQLHLIYLQIAKLLRNYLDQFCCLIVVRHFLNAHKQTRILYFRQQPSLGSPMPIDDIQRGQSWWLPKVAHFRMLANLQLPVGVNGDHKFRNGREPILHFRQSWRQVRCYWQGVGRRVALYFAWQFPVLPHLMEYCTDCCFHCAKCLTLTVPFPKCGM